jgi:hypothetical protein
MPYRGPRAADLMAPASSDVGLVAWSRCLGLELGRLMPVFSDGQLALLG